MACNLEPERACSFTQEAERECAETCETLAEYEPLDITTECPLLDGEVGVPYSVQLQATGGKTPYTWSLVSGSLPTGLTLSSSGLISGTIGGSAGVFIFTFRVTDALGQTAEATCQIGVDVPLPDVPDEACGILDDENFFHWLHNSLVGPFHGSTPGVVAFIGKADDNSRLIAVVSQDYGETWALEDDSHPVPAGLYASFMSRQYGDNIRVATHEVHASGKVQFHNFSLSSLTWTKLNKTVIAASGVPAAGAETCTVSVCQLSDGKILVAYDGTPETVSGTAYQRCFFKTSSDGGDTWSAAVPFGHVGQAVHNVLGRVMEADDARALCVFGNTLPGFGSIYAQTLKSDGTMNSNINTVHTGNGLYFIQTGRCVGDYCVWEEGGNTRIAVPVRLGDFAGFALFTGSDDMSHDLLFLPTGHPTTFLAVGTAICPQVSMRHDGTHLHIMGNLFNNNPPTWFWHKKAASPYTTWSPGGGSDNQAGPNFTAAIPGQQLAATIVMLNGEPYYSALYNSANNNLGLMYVLIKVSDLPTDSGYTIVNWSSDCSG